MKVVFLGVGEAFDENLANTSIWVRTKGKNGTGSVLLDCGFTAPSVYWRQDVDQEELDAVWISHFHGDHFFGIPTLLLKFWEMKRKKPLVFIGQTRVEEIVRQTMNLAYPNFLNKLGFPLEFVPVSVNQSIECVGFTWSFAESGHGQRNLALRLDDDKRTLFYSGDGLPTEETLALARGCTLIVHEAFMLEEPVAGHGTVRRCLDFARQAGASFLALVHLQRDERLKRREEILNTLNEASNFLALLPEPGDVLEI